MQAKAPDANLTPEQRVQLDDRFPAVTVPYEPMWDQVCVQECLPVGKTKGGIILTEVTRDHDQLLMNVGKVVGIGPHAFRDDMTGEALTPMFAVGDYVLLPTFNATRPKSAQEVDVNGQKRRPVFRHLMARHVLSRVVDISELLR